MVCPSEGTQNSRCLSKARPMTATERGKDSSIYISTEYEGFVKHLLCVSHWSGGLLGWVYSLNHFTMLWFAPLEVPRILDNFQKLGQWQQQYVNMIHSYAHPQHMKAVKHLIYVWHWSESPLGWVYPQPLCYSLVCPSWGTQNSRQLLKATSHQWEQWYYGKDSSICTCHSIWRLYDNLYAFDLK